MADEKRLTHLNEAGEAHMVDVADKAVTHRRAVAEAYVHAAPETIAMIAAGSAKKGDVFATARIAGIMAAKQTAGLIPLCPPDCAHDRECGPRDLRPRPGFEASLPVARGPSTGPPTGTTAHMRESPHGRLWLRTTYNDDVARR